MNFLGWGRGKDGGVSAATGAINSQAAATGASGQKVVTTSLSVTVGDIVLLHQTQGTGAGTNVEQVKVASVGSGEFTASKNLQYSYTTGAQAVKGKEYTGGTCSNTLSINPWDGSKGGVGFILVNGHYTHSGTIDGSGVGFRGGAGVEGGSGTNSGGNQGEGASGTGSVSTSANGQGGGGGATNTSPTGWGGRAGGGGGHITAGNGGSGGGGNGALGSAGSSNSSKLIFGGGGGAGGGDNEANPAHGAGGNGGKGGGIWFIVAKRFTLSGSWNMNGANGQGGQGSVESSNHTSGGGGGAGGSGYLMTQKAVLGTGLATASGGSGGAPPADGGTGGAGGTGSFHVEYLYSVSGSTTPSYTSSKNGVLADGAGAFLLAQL